VIVPQPGRYKVIFGFSGYKYLSPMMVMGKSGPGKGLSHVVFGTGRVGRRRRRRRR
jgi:hypothetical protein